MTDKNEKNINFLTRTEQNFDWNLIALISVWIFLLTTFFLIFIG